MSYIIDYVSNGKLVTRHEQYVLANLKALHNCENMNHGDLSIFIFSIYFLLSARAQSQI